MKEPARLFSEGGRLAEAIDRARQQTPDATSMSNIASGLSLHGVDVAAPSPAAPPPEAPAPTTPSTAKPGWSASTKVGLGIGGLVALGLIGGLLAETPLVVSGEGAAARDGSVRAAASQTLEPKAAPAPASSPRDAVVPAAQPLEATANAEPSPAPDVPSGNAAPSTAAALPDADAPSATRGAREAAAARSHERGTPSEPNQVEAPLANPETEISLLKRARETLANNPGTSFALAEEHRKTYARGRLGQEREVIAITALMRLGRPSAAHERAEQFKRTYPGSAYLGQIERVVSSR